MSYPQRLIERVAERIGISYRVQVLDVQTGAGSLALPLARTGARVTAMDSAAEHVALAANNAEQAALRIQAVQRGVEGLGPDLGRFRLVTIGSAIREVDRVRMLAALDGLIVPAGGVAVFELRYPNVQDNLWHEELRWIAARHGSDRPRDPYPHGGTHEDVLLRSPFDQLERMGVLERRVTPVEDVVARVVCSAYQNGRWAPNAAALAAAVRRATVKHARDGHLHEVVEACALVARRSADLKGRWV
ncbi:MAG TPA: class I SAM-dependent methyltransferase [Polyangiales bacterium]